LKGISFNLFKFIDWIECKSKEDEIVKAIWRVWCYEQEHRPRAGIILLYLDASESPEVSFSQNDFAITEIFCRFF
jgi:hypothetical protein